MTDHETLLRGTHSVVEDARTDEPTFTLMDGKKRLVGPVPTTKKSTAG
jgi:hypothetical protein